MPPIAPIGPVFWTQISHQRAKTATQPVDDSAWTRMNMGNANIASEKGKWDTTTETVGKVSDNQAHRAVVIDVTVGRSGPRRGVGLCPSGSVSLRLSEVRLSLSRLASEAKGTLRRHCSVPPVPL